jgi:hypothetical protein
MAAESPHDTTTAIGSTRSHDRSVLQPPLMIGPSGEKYMFVQMSALGTTQPSGMFRLSSVFQR